MHDLIIVIACLGVILVPAVVVSFPGTETEEE